MATHRVRLTDLFDAEKTARGLLEDGKVAEALEAVDQTLTDLAAAGVAVPADKTIGASAQRVRAKALLALGRMDEARAALDKIARDPALQRAGLLELSILSEALLLRAGLIEASDVDRVIADMRRLARVGTLARDRLEPLCRAAVLYARIGQAGLAAEMLAEAKGLSDSSGLSPYYEGLVALELGEPERARALFEAVVQRKRRAADLARAALPRCDAPPPARPAGDGAAAFARAEGHAAAGRTSEARAAYREAARSDRRHAAAARALGAALLDDGEVDRDEALHWLAIAAALEPDHAGGHALLGRLHERFGAHEAARASYEHALALDPGAAALRAALARVLAALGRDDEAQKLLASSDDPDAHVALGRRRWSAGQGADALAALAPALGLEPPHAAAALLAAEIELASGHAAAAVGHLERVHAAGAPSAALEVALGRALAADGRALDALAAFERALVLAPADAAALAASAGALADAGRMDEALSRSRALVTSLAPNDPDAIVALAAHAALLRRAERAAEAESLLLEAVAEAPCDVARSALLRAHYESVGASAAGASWALTEEGYRALAAGAHDEALAVFERARAAEPGEARHAIDAARAALRKRASARGEVDRAEEAVAAAPSAFLLVRFAGAVLEGKLLGRAQRLVEVACAADPSDNRVPDAYAAFLARSDLARERTAFLEWLTALRRGNVRVRPLRTASRTPEMSSRARAAGEPALARTGANDLLRLVRTELEAAGRLNELVATLDAMKKDAVPVNGPASLVATLSMWHAKALYRVGRTKEAGLTARQALEQGVQASDAGEAWLVLARVELAASRLDPAIWSAQAAYEAHGTQHRKGEALALQALCYEHKRASRLADQRLERAEALAGTGALLARGHIHLLRDERLEARAAFAHGLRARRERSDVEGHRLGLARVATLLGELDAAGLELAACEDVPDAVRVRARRAELLRMSGDGPGERALLERNLALSPAHDGAASDKLRLAELRLAAGDREGALAALDDLRGALRDDESARAVFARAERLAQKLRAARAASEPAKRVLLGAFPTVAQKRDHCGPCAIELVLRYFGKSLDGDAIARAVKGPRGTTPLAMRTFLAAQGFAVRRAEVSLASLRALIDRGIPVVLEEAYPTSSHVAVAIGYDDELELLAVQDPMTHALRHTPYEDLARLRGLFGHGAIVAVPGDDAARVAALAELGIEDSPAVLATELAFEHLRAHEWDAARARFEAALEASPSHEIAWLGRLQAASGRLEADGAPPEATSAFAALVAEAARRFPGAEWVERWEGRAAFRAGRLPDALAAFQRAHERDPADPENLWLMGECLRALGQGDAAVALYFAALERDPAHVEAHESLAAAFIQQKDAKRARYFTELALGLDPDDAQNHESQGLIHELDGLREEAVACFDRALARDPKRARSAVARGRCLLALGRRADADASFARALATSPKSALVRLEIAEALLEAEDARAAYAVIEPARELAPDAPNVNAMAGACLFRLERPDEAEALLQKALAVVPDYRAAERELARGLVGAQRWEAALALFEKRRAREPADPRHALDAAEARLALGQKDEAVAAALAVRARAGAMPDVVNRVAKLLHDAGRFAEARAVFEEPIERALDGGKIDRPLVRAYGSFLAAIGDESAAYVWARIEAGYAALGQAAALEIFEELKRRAPHEPRHELDCILAIEALGHGEQAFERSRKLLETTGFRVPRLLRRHAELGHRTNLLGGTPGKVFEEALAKNPDDVGIMEALVQHQVDMGFGDSHYAVWWKKKLDDVKKKKAGVAGGGASS